MFISRNQLPDLKPTKIARGRERGRLDKLAEDIGIQWGELNKLAREVLAKPDLRDVSLLTVGDNRRMVDYLKHNFGELERKYRRMRWK